ncbi:MAG: hypothetical protein B6D62_02850 [Candidatus Cloacimonas sp. 4484_275]|nr:MAG: hypothetical protein B6D62_02850 [Candidatus Cloacimonas sp. 4484_275]
MADVQDNENIRLLTNTEIVNTAGHRLHFEITARRKPRYIKDSIDMDICMGCEKCVQVCPVSVPNEWEQGIKSRKAIYIPAALAIPYKYAIDKNSCLHFNDGSCNKCAEVCPQQANRSERKTGFRLWKNPKCCYRMNKPEENIVRVFVVCMPPNLLLCSNR